MIKFPTPTSLPACLLIGALLSACAGTPESYVLLPGGDGQRSELQVIPHARPALKLDQPYQAAEVGSRSQQVTQLDAQAVNSRYAATLAVQPPAPQRHTIYFREGSDTLTDASARDFAGIPASIASRPTPDVVVIGHTDTVGRLEDNDRLAYKRAEKLRDILISAGVAGENIQVAGRGERELLIATPDETPEPRNRRVEIVVR